MAGKQFFAYEDLSVSTTAVGFTAATRGEADYASVLVETGPVRFRMSGTPTATAGDVLPVGTRVEFESASEIAGVKFISVEGNTATLRCSFAKER